MCNNIINDNDYCVLINDDINVWILANNNMCININMN